MTEPSFDVGLRALRDFFSARNAADIQSAAHNISKSFQMPLEPVASWVEVEYDFNRLFVGPLAVPAPPYASAYQDEPILMGAPALEVRALYHQLGFAVQDEGSTPDDHLAFELDAVVACNFLLEQVNEIPDGITEVRNQLVCGHLQDWVPRFIDVVRQQDAVSQPVSMAVSALEQWLSGAVVSTFCSH